ncbi:sugar nucleotide-binding protein [Iamia sp. SCSIO 61187]|uniref:SDR family oxidoreductase n=1 Tax=Iamia sp. SCSIO 61187 TaxID=2722752 RepID=UPI001C62D07A|nr:sugar nucleotide-binding protein [Iamia sp. SCSIO 61187]QYG92997.1 sugar nucleotide-binding protein [Iamia sp. SCSIO 61187]
MTGAVLLTGASGLLGTWLRRKAPEGVEVVGLTHRTGLGSAGGVIADLRDSIAVVSAVNTVGPSLMLHAAYSHDQESIVGATENVVDAAQRAGAAVLFVSSDAVFSGDGSPRGEDARPDPIWSYGRWKAQAEAVVAERAEGSAIVRLPLIVSIDPDDHVVARIRRGAALDEPTAWFDDELRQPAAAPELADALWRIALLAPADRAGAWHLPGPETLSRYEIAQRVIAALDLDATAIRAEGTPLSANRPRHLAIDDRRARDRIGWSPSRVLRGTLPP